MLYHDSSWLLHREHMVVVHHHYLGPLPLTLACPISGNHAKRFPHTLPLTQRPEPRRDSSCPVGPPAERRTRLPPSVDQRQAHLRPGHGKDQHWLGVLGKPQDTGDCITGLALAGQTPEQSNSSAQGYSILRAIFPPSSSEVSGILPGGCLLPEPSPVQPQSPALSFDSALLPTPCDGALAPSSTPLCQEMFPSFE